MADRSSFFSVVLAESSSTAVRQSCAAVFVQLAGSPGAEQDRMK